MSTIGTIAGRAGQYEADQEMQELEATLARLNALENSGSDERAKDAAKINFIEKFVRGMKKGSKENLQKAGYVLALLGLNWWWRQRHHAEESYTKAKVDMLKLEADKIKAEYFKEELWREQVKKTHDMQMARAFFGYTGGAIKELGKLSNYAFWLEGVDTKISWDQKEIISGLINGHDNAFTFRELAAVYNEYYDDPNHGWQALRDRHASKAEFEKYGFDMEFSRKLDPSREYITLPELTSIGVWLLAQKGDDGMEPAVVGKDKKIRGLEIADSKRYRDEWEFALGFDKHKDLVKGNRDLWQKWLMWNMKTTSVLQEGYTRNTGDDKNDPKYGSKALAQYQHTADYYHRSLSMAVGGQIGRAQLENRQKQEELLTDFADSIALTIKKHEGEDLTEEEEAKLQEADSKLKEQLNEELEEEQIVKKIVDRWIEDYAADKGMARNPKDRTERENDHLKYVSDLLVKKLQQKWALEKKKRPVMNGQPTDLFEDFAQDLLDEYDDDFDDD